MGYFNQKDYVELTMHFVCNLKCEHCMIEGTMDVLAPETMDRLDEVIAYNRAHGLWKGVILTGSEITLRRDLPEIARKIRDSGFDHVRIQTHGMRLANARYCAELVDAGIDEFFVSVTAADAQTHDAIAVVPGSFDKTLRGLENLDAFEGIVSHTNTVITKRSYQQLPEVVESLRHLKRLVQMEFWNFFPMSETDEKDLLVPHVEILPYLKEAIHKAREYGREVEVKNFPECLLGDDRSALDNTQSHLIIDPDFWTQFMRNGFYQCTHRDYCGAKQCQGLNTAYVNRFGWESDILVPLPEGEPRS
jgi:MoaA/NifB/PqqE/SkfB family radical SAM enzyme